MMGSSKGHGHGAIRWELKVNRKKRKKGPGGRGVGNG